MKAIIVTPGASGVKVSEIQEQQSEGTVKIKTLHTGVCGTDFEIANGKLGIARPESGSELVLGHEAIGIVESAPRDSGFSPGDVVVPMVRRPGGCANCKKGRQDYCLDGDFVEAGIRGKNGFMREYFYEKPDFLVKVENAANSTVCVLTEPTKNIMKILEAVTVASKRSLWEGLAGRGAWIFGTGTEGLLAAAVFRDAGTNVMLVNRRDPTDVEKGIAEKLGARFFNTTNGDWNLAIREVPMDLVIDTVGMPQILTDSVQRIGHTGIVVLFGTGGQGSASQIDGTAVITLVDKNATVVGCEDGAKEHYANAVKFIGDNATRYGLADIITGHYSKGDLSVFEKRKPGEIKRVIDW